MRMRLVALLLGVFLFGALLSHAHAGGSSTNSSQQQNQTCVFQPEQDKLYCYTDGSYYIPQDESHVQPLTQAFWLDIAMCFVLVITAGLMSGLTMGLMSMDLMNIKIIAKSGTERQQLYAKRIQPIIKQHHWLLCTLLLANALAMEALPLFLDRLTSPAVAIIISVTAVLVFGEIIPQALCTRFGLAIGGNTTWLVWILMVVLGPISWPISKLLDFFLGVEHSTFYRRNELKELVAMHTRPQDLESQSTAAGLNRFLINAPSISGDRQVAYADHPMFGAMTDASTERTPLLEATSTALPRSSLPSFPSSSSKSSDPSQKQKPESDQQQHQHHHHHDHDHHHHHHHHHDHKDEHGKSPRTSSSDSALSSKQQHCHDDDEHCHEAGGELSRHEVQIIRGALDLKEKTVLTCLTEWKRVVFLRFSDVLNAKKIAFIKKYSFSRIPIIGASPTEMYGTLLVKDLVGISEDVPVDTLQLRRLPLILPTTHLHELLNLFIQGGSHIAIVVTSATDLTPLGLVTLEDVIEQLLGRPVWDETDIPPRLLESPSFIMHHQDSPATELGSSPIAPSTIAIPSQSGSLASSLRDTSLLTLASSRYGHLGQSSSVDLSQQMPTTPASVRNTTPFYLKRLSRNPLKKNVASSSSSDSDEEESSLGEQER